MINSGLPKLRQNELPGPKCWNKLVEILETISSDSPIVTFNSQPGGGIVINVAAALASATPINNTLWLTLDSDDEKWSLTAGSIRIAPSTVVSVAAVVGQAATAGYIWIEWNGSTATVQTGATLPNLVNMTNKKIRTPLGRIIDQSGKLSLERMHPGGDICVYDCPWILIDGYTKGTKGYRVASTTGEETYVTPSQCQPTQGA